MKDRLLVVDALGKRFGSLEAVRDVSFSVDQGEIFSLLGPNGAGKTTTISMLSCLLTPTSGSATIGGHSITRDSLNVRRLIGVVPQEIALYGELTARQNLHFWGQMYDLGGAALRTRVEEVLEQVDLRDRANDRVGTFSGGMKRRINIAAGLLHKPRLLFMDEPTVGIDPQSRRRILDMVKALRDEGMTILYTTHYMEEAQELSDRLGIIDHGRLIALGTLGELTRLVGQQQTLHLHWAGEEGANRPISLDNLPEVLAVTSAEDGVILSVTDATASLPAIMQRVAAAGITLRSIDIREPNLEAVFLHLTGRALRN
jgi:ABC-2 type transport system ATP-binding protein